MCLEFVYKVNAQTTKSRKTAPLKSRGLRVNRNIFLKYYLIFSILGICRVKWKRKKIRFLFPSASNFRPKLGTPHWWRSIIECSRKRVQIQYTVQSEWAKVKYSKINNKSGDDVIMTSSLQYQVFIRDNQWHNLNQDWSSLSD